MHAARKYAHGSLSTKNTRDACLRHTLEYRRSDVLVSWARAAKLRHTNTGEMTAMRMLISWPKSQVVSLDTTCWCSSSVTLPPSSSPSFSRLTIVPIRKVSLEHEQRKQQILLLEVPLSCMLRITRIIVLRHRERSIANLHFQSNLVWQQTQGTLCHSQHDLGRTITFTGSEHFTMRRK